MYGSVTLARCAALPYGLELGYRTKSVAILVPKIVK